MKNLNETSITGLSLVPQGKCTPGLSKVEFKGDKMIGLCSKSYSTELSATKNSSIQVKFGMKSVNKGQFTRVQHGLSPSGNLINMHKIGKIASVRFNSQLLANT